MKRKLFFSFALLLCSHFLIGQITWDFNTGSDGWSMTHTLSYTSSGGIMTLHTNGTDPYMHSPAVSLNTSTVNCFKVRLKNNTPEFTFQLYWITSTSGNWEEVKSYYFNVNQSDPSYTEYVIYLYQLPLWTGTVTQLRFDPGSGLSGIPIDIDYIKLEYAQPFSLDNGTIKVGMDLNQGGAINYLSQSTPAHNLVNIHDYGRYIQQSYYAGDTIRRGAGQAPGYTPWNWNPVQAGDCMKNQPRMLAFSNNGTQLYTKCQPLLWDMTNNEYAQCYFEQWVTLENNTVHVSNRLTSFRTDNIWYPSSNTQPQELPAIFLIGELSNRYSHSGSAPWTNEPLIGCNNTCTAGYKPNTWSTQEHWGAFMNNSNLGVGVYNSTCTEYCGVNAGTGGPYDDHYSYLSPRQNYAIGRNEIYNYNYDLVVGSLLQIRKYAYEKENKQIYQWNFINPPYGEGWIIGSSSNANVSNGNLNLTVIAADPNIISPVINADASKYKYLKIRMKNSSTDNTAQIFWITSADQTWNQQKSVVFSIIPNDPNYTEYFIDLSTISNWNGTIPQFRVDPVNSVSTGTVAIDYIKLVSDPFAMRLSSSNNTDGNSDELSNDKFFVYPNPLNSNNINVFLNSSNFTEGTISIVNSLGKTIYEKTITDTGNPDMLIYVDTMANGIYTVTYTNLSGKKVSAKFVKE